MKLLFLPFLLAGCAAPVAQTIPQQTTLMLLAGSSEAKLSGFEAAARQCGFGAIERVPDGHGGEWIRIVGTTSWIADNPSLACAMRYISEHPDGLYFVGNEAR
jgi:hypothetical protein